MWRYFFFPMAGLLCAVVVVTIWSGTRYGIGFWQSFLAQFYATVIGVVASILFAWALWRMQLTSERRQRARDLVCEARFNAHQLRRLIDIARSLEMDEPSEFNVFWWMHSATFRLRTTAMRNIMRPECLVQVKPAGIVDELEWLLPYSEAHNDSLENTAYEHVHAFYTQGEFRDDTTDWMFGGAGDWRSVSLWAGFNNIVSREKELLRG